eukprot:jgi/Tetstr1/431146/TSEL_020858.t1
MGTGVHNASVDGPCHNPTGRAMESTLKDPRPVPTFGGTPIVSSVHLNKVVTLPLAGTATSPKLHGLMGVLAQQQKRAGGIIKHNTNPANNLAATQAISGDNVDEGSSPEPPAKKAKQPAAKPAAGGGENVSSPPFRLWPHMRAATTTGGNRDNFTTARPAREALASRAAFAKDTAKDASTSKAKAEASVADKAE